MDTPEIPEQTGSGESGTPPSLESAWVIVSDIHKGEGQTIEVQRRHQLKNRLVQMLHRLLELTLKLIGVRIGRLSPLGTVEIPNPLEDFPYDDVFVAFVRRIIATWGHANVLGLKMMGDCFDALAVTCEGRQGVRPTEGVGANKMKKIIRGHPRSFDILAEFIALPNAYLDIFTGNHDSFLNWPAVQRILIRRISKGDALLAAKIRFVDYRSRYRQVEDGVLFDHGMNAEPHTALDPDKPFITERLGKKLRNPELNEPIGNLMTEQVVNPSKIRNDNLARLKDAESWTEAVRRGRYFWGLFIGWNLAVFAAKSAHRLRTILEVVFATTKHDPVDDYGESILREYGGIIVAVFLGHSHRAKRSTVAGLGTYINVGSPARIRRLEWPNLAYHWKSFRKIEELWRGFLHHLYSAKTPVGRKVTVSLLYLVVMGLIIAFLQTSFIGAWAYTLTVIKGFAIVTFAFLVLKSFTHLFMVKPDVVEYQLFTCGLKRCYSDGTLLVDLMEFNPIDDVIREYV